MTIQIEPDYLDLLAGRFAQRRREAALRAEFRCRECGKYLEGLLEVSEETCRACMALEVQ